MCDLFDPRAALSLLSLEKMADHAGNRQSCEKVFRDGNASISEGMGEKMDSAVSKACRGSGVPLRAFWREMGSDFTLARPNPGSGLSGYRMGHQTSVGASLIAMLLPVW